MGVHSDGAGHGHLLLLRRYHNKSKQVAVAVAQSSGVLPMSDSLAIALECQVLILAILFIQDALFVWV
jgi:hypothetical protein